MEKAEVKTYNQETILSPEPWELVDRVGAIYNRLVMWDAKMIHSASSYAGIVGQKPEDSRLVQLFFFD